jgi:hypothetical protein
MAVQAQAVQPQECEAVTSIEIVHRVGSAQVTDKVRLEPGTSADPAQALRGFQRAADHFGQDNIISTRPITEVMCFPADTSTDPESGHTPAAHTRSKAAAVANVDGLALCANGSVVYFCDDLTPINRYDYDGGGSCTVSSYGDAASFACGDSGLIVSRRGDVVMTVNTDNVRQEVLARTQALRRLVGDANVLTNFHFNIAISPDQQAALVDNAAFRRIAQQVQQASQLGQPLPDIQQLLHELPQQPTNVAFFEQLKKAYQTRQERLEILAQITNGAQLSAAQVNAFYQQFVGKSQLIDKLLVERTATSLKAAARQLNDTIELLASNSPLSTIYEQVKAVARAVLEANTTCGVFDPDHVVPFVPAELYQFLTDADLQKRQIAATRLIDFNERLRTSGARKLAEATSGLLGLLAVTMGKNDMDKVWRVYDQVEATEFFVEGGDPRGTRFDVQLTDQARTMFHIDVAPTSAAAYDVITVLNEVADYNAQTGKITVDYQAVITLNARAALRTSDAVRALYHTEEAYNALDVAKGFLGGILDDFGSTASGIFHMATHPWETYEGLKAAIINWDQTLALVWQQGADLIHRWPNMTPVEKADFMGHLAAQILTTLPAEARQAARIDQAVRDAVKLHLDEANLGLRIAERAGASLAPEAASELARRMEQLGVTALDDMVDLAGELDDYLPCRLVGSGPALRVGVSAVKPPCNAIQISRLLESLGVQSRALGLPDAQLADGIVASAKAGLRSIGVDLWESKAGLRYGDDNIFRNRVLHVLNHTVDNPTRTRPHGVFDAGRRGALGVVDEGWRKALVEGSSDVLIIPQHDGRLRYEINMHRRIGFVGGAPGAAAGHPVATYLAIVVENGRDVVTAYPFRK